MLKNIITYSRAWMWNAIGDEEGATAVEYGLMVALVAILIIAAVLWMTGGLQAIFNSIGDRLRDPEGA